MKPRSRPSVPPARWLAGPAHKRDRQNAEIGRVLTAMKRGATLHLSHSPRRHWRLSSGAFLTEETARAVIASPNIVDVGDTLFDAELSQTFRSVE
jgi:hypothetical protein